MPERWLGVVVSAELVRVVDASIPDDGGDPIVIQADYSWPLQKGPRPAAFHVMFQQIAGYADENGVDRAIIKASALSQGRTKKAHLEAAELRGVIMCALASVTKTECLAKAYVSRTFGERKVDDYVKDSKFWEENVTGGTLRTGSREAAMVILATRSAMDG